MSRRVRLPPLSVNELLRRPLTEDRDLYWLTKPFYREFDDDPCLHIPEVVTQPKVCQGVAVQWVHRHDPPHQRRVWVCGVACYGARPFMVFQNGGREGDDEHARWVFDGTVYVNAVRALGNCSRVRVPELIKTHWPIAGMAAFYGRHLDETDPPWSDVNFDEGEF